MKTNVRTKILVSSLLISTTIGCAQAEFAKMSENLESGIGEPSKSVTYSDVVASANKQVDFLLVVDDSNSMLADQKKLAAKLSTFVSSLENSQIDWQMCMTSTRGVASSNGEVWGAPLNWLDYSPAPGVPSHVLTKGTPDLHNIFVDTMNAVGVGNANSGDERGIKAAYHSFASANSSGCYRKDAAVSVILISDEDEASVGGDITRLKSVELPSSFKPLVAEDMPVVLLGQSKAIFGQNVRFTFNSIILKPGDTACEASQDQETSPSHAGTMYAHMSALTGGGVASICDADYTDSLNTFKDKIINSLSQLKLTCVPDVRTVKVKINGVEVSNYSLVGSVLNFKSALIEGTKIDLYYDCL